MRPVVPNMAVLLEDPTFRSYMKRVPPAHHALSYGEPWQLWFRRHDGVWLTRTYASYRDVWPVFVKRVKFIHDYPGQDVTITSRRLFYAPPGEYYRVKVRRPRRPTPDNPSTTKVVVEERWRQTFFWDDIRLRWCGRCRRPVYWAPLHSGHHALRRQPAISTDGNPERCFICGIRSDAMPDVDQMVRI